jgi:hypothetical protein
MTADDLRALIQRVEWATGPDRELDAEIARAVGKKIPRDYSRAREQWTWSSEDNYTASLDTAVSMIPAGWGWSVSTTGAGPVVAFGHPPDKWRDAVDWIDDTPGATPALAVACFALRARLAEMESRHAIP